MKSYAQKDIKISSEDLDELCETAVNLRRFIGLGELLTLGDDVGNFRGSGFGKSPLDTMKSTIANGQRFRKDVPYIDGLMKKIEERY